MDIREVLEDLNKIAVDIERNCKEAAIIRIKYLEKEIKEYLEEEY